uniref:Uncharacterized protein n=1 Tax=Ixodes ricinus TaxID=34613 RepID=A0A6B0UQW1_IXORI
MYCIICHLRSGVHKLLVDLLFPRQKILKRTTLAHKRTVTVLPTPHLAVTAGCTTLYDGNCTTTRRLFAVHGLVAFSLVRKHMPNFRRTFPQKFGMCRTLQNFKFGRFGPSLVFTQASGTSPPLSPS